MQKTVVKLVKKSDHNSSVRFDSLPNPDGTEAALKNAYINRTVPGIGSAQSVTITIEVPQS
jgi:hypothetical protein